MPVSTHALAHSVLRSHRQQGTVLVQFALLLGVLVTILGTVQIGHMYYAKRDLQRIADLAAIEAVNALTYGEDSTKQKAVDAGNQSIDVQWPASITKSDGKQIVTPGHWSKSLPAIVSSSGILNAAEVVVEGESIKLLPFTGNRVVKARAIAAKASEPIAAFSVGAQLLRLENQAFLGQLLQQAGLNLDTLTVLDSNGVLNASIAPSGLLQAIGRVAGIEQLINLDLAALTPDGVVSLPDVTIADIVRASASVVEGETVDVLLNLANAIGANANIGALRIPLIGSTGGTGVFAFVGSGANNSPVGAAADVQVGLSDVLKTALALGVDGRALSLPLSLLGETVQMRLTVVEPPSIGIGPVGTKAYNAQIRLNLDVDTDEVPGLGKLLSATLLRLDLPLALDLVTAEGTLDKISCDARPPMVDIRVESSVGDICIGHVDPAAPGRCSDTLTPTNALDLRLLFIPLVRVDIQSHVPLLVATPQTLEDFTVEEPPRQTAANDLLLGTTVERLLDELEVNPNLLGIPLGFLSSTVVDILRPILTALLADPLDGLGQYLLSPVLVNLLGLEVGRTEVDVLAIQCDTAQLVY